MFSLLFLPFRILSGLLANKTMLVWVVLPALAVGLLVHFAPPQFWPLFRLYAIVEVVLSVMVTAGK